MLAFACIVNKRSIMLALMLVSLVIALRGTELNGRINLFRGLERFNLGLALIGFRTTGAWLVTIQGSSHEA